MENDWVKKQIMGEANRLSNNLLDDLHEVFRSFYGNENTLESIDAFVVIQHNDTCYSGKFDPFDIDRSNTWRYTGTLALDIRLELEEQFRKNGVVAPQMICCKLYDKYPIYEKRQQGEDELVYLRRCERTKMQVDVYAITSFVNIESDTLAWWIIESFARLYPHHLHQMVAGNGGADAIHYDAVNEYEKHILAKTYTTISTPIITQISSQFYEGAKASGSICTTRSSKNRNSSNILFDLSIAFKREIPCTLEHVQEIRKLIEMLRDDTCLVVDRIYRIPVVLGIAPLSKIRNREDALEYRISGHMQWELNKKNEIMFAYKEGHFSIPHEHYKEAIRQFCDKYFPDDETDLLSIIEEARKQRHGTSVMISSTQGMANEMKRLCAEKVRGYEIECISLLEERDKLVALTSIDGAIYIDNKCNCTGIGVILDGEATAKGNPARGARYNSVRNYVKWRAETDAATPIMGVVISEDGHIDVFCSGTNEKL